MARRRKRSRKRSSRRRGAEESGKPAPASVAPGDREPMNPDDPAFNRDGRAWATPAEQQHLETAREFMRRREFTRATEHLQPLVQMSPDLAEAHHELAIAFRFAGHTAEAISAAREAAKLRPRWEMARVLLGRLYFEHGEHENAAASCRLALDLGSQHPDLFLVLGQACKQLSQPAEAHKAFEILATIQPQSAEAHYQLGLTLRQLGDEPKAQAEFLRAFQLDPRHEGARRVLSRGTPDPGPLGDRPTDAMESQRSGKRPPDLPLA